MDDGFFGGALDEAQNNIKGFLSSIAPSMPLPSFQPTDNNWGVQNFQSSDNSWGIQGFQPADTGWGIPRFPQTDNSWGIQGFQPNDNWSLNEVAPRTGTYAGPWGGNQQQQQTHPGSSTVTVPTNSPYYQTAVNAAKAVGIDPALFTAQIAKESSFNPTAVSPKGARGIAQIMPQYHPGVNPDDPEASLNYAAQLMSQYLKKYGGDARWALAAYNMGEGAVDQLYKQSNGTFSPNLFTPDVNKYITDIIGARSAPTGPPVQTPGSAVAPTDPSVGSAVVPTSNTSGWGGYNTQTLVPNQYTEGLALGFDRDKALAICGPAAAVAFTRAYGRAPATLADATEAARIQGLWDVASGMHGPESEASLMRYLGVPVHAETGVDWNKVKTEVLQGRPVALSAPTAQGGHYLVAVGYDPATGKFDFGQSAAVMIASGGNTKYTPAGLGTIGIGMPQYAIYMDK